ncbi:uncharacterized protein [Rutidosis leptorrhynchoides]|uniref:uncharacterized protein isoform X2 n=1 Tax=Rutidosis leptorrhynchoides TaxID=125765 RepID=UPI003A99A738
MCGLSLPNFSSVLDLKQKENNQINMADLEKKQVVLVVEGTTALGPYWPTILKDHLSNLIRSFCDDGSSSSYEDNVDEESLKYVEFAVFVFNGACGSSNSTWWLQKSKWSNWTNNVTCVMNWLSTIDFSSGGAFSDAATTVQGLYHALTMFRLSNERSPYDHNTQRHCILVAACNPDSSPHFLDVGKYFLQMNVSLSAIYASELPQHGVICNEGKDKPVSGVETVTQSLHHMTLTPCGNSKMRSMPGYVHVWEGDLYDVVPPGRRLLLTRLHAFMPLGASKFVGDWPSSIQFEFIGPTNVEKWIKKCVGKTNVVVFHAKLPDEVLGKMHKENLSAIIKLPSQLMIFIVTNNPSRFLGLIFDQTPEQQEIMLKRWKHRRDLINKRYFESQTPQQRQENPV